MADRDDDRDDDAGEPEQEQQEDQGNGVPIGERIVSTQGQTFVLKTVEVKTNEEDEDVLHTVYEFSVRLTLQTRKVVQI